MRREEIIRKKKVIQKDGPWPSFYTHLDTLFIGRCGAKLIATLTHETLTPL